MSGEGGGRKEISLALLPPPPLFTTVATGHDSPPFPPRSFSPESWASPGSEVRGYAENLILSLSRARIGARIGKWRVGENSISLSASSSFPPALICQNAAFSPKGGAGEKGREIGRCRVAIFLFCLSSLFSFHPTATIHSDKKTLERPLLEVGPTSSPPPSALQKGREGRGKLP